MTAQQSEAGQPEQEPSTAAIAYEPATVEACQEDYRRHQALDPKPPLPRLPEDES